MRLDEVTAEIRPRSDWEAVDLGFALVRRDFWRCFSAWWLAVLVPTAATAWWLWERPMLWLLLFWWWKPAGSRMVLFELSRRLFGERPAWSRSLKEIPRAWTRRFFHRFILGRLSPWLPVTLAVEDLEGLRGRAHKQRRQQLARRGEGVVMWIYLIADLAACWFGLAILMLAGMFIPEGQDGAWQMALESWDPSNPTEIPPLILRVVAVCVMLAMSLTDVFVTGAGFGIYLNNRTWLEGWDVELALKRLARRLGGVALLGMLLALVWLPQTSRADEAADPAQVIRAVKMDADFKVHTVIERIPKGRENRWNLNWLRLGGAAEWLGKALVCVVVASLLAALAWLLWTHRHLFRIRGTGGAKTAGENLTARVVVGLEVSPETLPEDVPSAALALWRQGRHPEALGLLYRAAISRVIETARVEIRESDTEGDCLRRVEQAGAAAQPDYFRGITGAWTRMAYAGRPPEDVEVEALCRQWPFRERGEG
ncbi:MAG: DUF4129 domain-containing protein [Verrucomicrobiaceae bacterium]|nr:MAG: DUF4129 domain-containing protein [Verrucomicrobiaceae bacterium]